MAITVSGVESDLDVTEWAEYMEAHALASPSPDGVLLGLVASVSTGDRLLSVSAGQAVAPGVLVDSSAAESVTLAANSSGNSRIDAIVLEVNWSGTAATAGDVKAVTGTPGASPVAPTLTQTPGDVWQIPLAYVTVANGATQLVVGNVTSARSGSGYQALTLTSGYTQTNTPLSVSSAGPTIEFSGAFRRSGGNVTVGTAIALGTLPEWAWPRGDQGFAGVCDLSGVTTIVTVFVSRVGAVTVYPTTGTINDGDVIRILATWLRKV